MCLYYLQFFPLMHVCDLRLPLRCTYVIYILLLRHAYMIHIICAYITDKSLSLICAYIIDKSLSLGCGFLIYKPPPLMC